MTNLEAKIKGVSIFLKDLINEIDQRMSFEDGYLSHTSQWHIDHAMKLKLQNELSFLVSKDETKVKRVYKKRDKKEATK